MTTVTITTPVGPFSMSVEDGAVVRGVFGGESGRIPPNARDVVDLVRAYFDGDLEALDGIATAGRGTEHDRRVWRGLLGIPPGETRTYGELAAAIGEPRAARAVGTGCGRNPVALIVPCHRVVRADGGLGGYLYGVKRKRWLLRHESRGA